MTRVVATTVAVGTALVLAVVACVTKDLVVGDDLQLDGAPAPQPEGSSPESAPPSDGGEPTTDGGPTTCGVSGTCIDASEPCKQIATDGTCPSPSQICCASTCPQIPVPDPSACDGDASLALYDSSKCVVGYACPPVGCVDAGAHCVPLAPGTCPSAKIALGEYTCGPKLTLGLECCLP
jgi:hypothetical protein